MSKINNKIATDIFEHYNCSPAIFNINNSQTNIIEDIAIVQSFYGTDINRISATTNALKAMLKMTTRPEEWIFIEGQKSIDRCCFQWLKDYGISYKFVRLTDKQDNLFMKTPLWNIGALECKSNRLCFIDADIGFCDSNWLDSVNEKLGKEFNVMSLHGYSYYENQSLRTDIVESIGKKYEYNVNMNDGHYGFTLGITRDLYESIGRFDCTIVLDDLDYWTKIVGDHYIVNSELWQKHQSKRLGLKLSVGSTDNIICHYDHGDVNNRKYYALSNVIKDRIFDIHEIVSYDQTKPYSLPTWNLYSQIGRIVNNVIKDLNDSKNSMDVNELYFKYACNEFGQLQLNKLLVYSIIPDSFDVSDDNIYAFIQKLNSNIKNEHTLLLFCNSNVQFDGVLIPYSSTYVDFLQICRKDLELPEDLNVLYVQYDNSPNTTIEVTDIQDDVFAYSKAHNLLYFKNSKANCKKINKLKSVGRNMDEFLYFNNVELENFSIYSKYNY